ncbi:fatty acid desaturase [Pseudoruegeria sp. HB172150]|uniref:fatty acid desaturase n=1 Tax=Pseudoruegeria sp. HB172150 TaxID=2721164 RepID=UPI001557FC9D|nr:fatty acid desaturase [Pseudoruegeria sp. HB172150]
MSDTAAPDFRKHLRNYTHKNDWLAAASYFGTFAVFFPAMYLALTLVERSFLLALPFIVITAFAGVRLYVLMHDCGHHSLFSTKRANDIAGHVLSPFAMTPYRAMQYNHNMHHAYLGNLDHRETTEIYTMTLREWNEAGFWKRLYYRLYRNPFVLIPVGAFFTYFIAYRWPVNARRIGAASVILHNIAFFAWLTLVWYVFGTNGLLVFLGISLLSGMIGVFLVYLQHNFEDTYWDRKPELDFRKATLQGSSCLNLGWWWDLGTGNIAYHDIHHFMPAIPSYRLRKAHFALPPELDLPRIEWPEAIRSFRLKLWDEERELLVPFPKETATAAVPAE